MNKQEVRKKIEEIKEKINKEINNAEELLENNDPLQTLEKCLTGLQQLIEKELDEYIICFY